MHLGAPEKDRGDPPSWPPKGPAGQCLPLRLLASRSAAERERVCSCRQSGALFGPPPDTRADLAGRPQAWVCLAARRGSCRFKTNHSPSGPRRRCVEFLAKDRLVLFAPQLPALVPCLPVLGVAPPRKLPGSQLPDFSSPLGRSPGPSTATAGRMEASGGLSRCGVAPRQRPQRFPPPGGGPWA